MFIREAKEKADRLVQAMLPHVERITIAGSIRRGCQVVKDIEIVAIPKVIERPPLAPDLFGLAEPVVEVPLHSWALQQESASVMWIKPATDLIIPWQPKERGRYWRALIDGEIKLDLFLTTPEQWGACLLIRTGSKDFSHGVMTFARKHTRYRFFEGSFCNEHLRPLPAFEELDVFRALGLDYIEPRERAGWQSITVQGVQMFRENSFQKTLRDRREQR